MAASTSDAFVFFGATGDLAYKKIFPALQSMVRHGTLDVPVIGVAKSGWTVEQLRERATRQHHQARRRRGRRSLPEAVRAAATTSTATTRTTRPTSSCAPSWATRKLPTHYLAIPPSMFPVVVQGPGEIRQRAKNARVILEKPFGRDLVSARKLNDTLHQAFPEENIFRIDHYLGKEAVENLLIFRFANSFLEPIWNRNYVHSVQITMAEAFGVEGPRQVLRRGRRHSRRGAEPHAAGGRVPGHGAAHQMYVDSVRDEQVKIFRTIPPLSPANIVRGQFRGYRDEPGVSPHSDVETFAALRLEIDSWRWAGVPFLIRAGKRLPITATEVFVKLRKPPLSKMGGRWAQLLPLPSWARHRAQPWRPREASRPADGAHAGRAVGGEVHHQRRDGRLRAPADRRDEGRSSCCSCGRMRSRPRGRSSIPSWAIAVRRKCMSQALGVRRIRANWRPTLAAGTIRNRSGYTFPRDIRIARQDEAQRLVDSFLDSDPRSCQDLVWLDSHHRRTINPICAM